VIKLPSPYCVMATQNPVEQEGTYPLPEAQVDRFLLKIIVGYPELDEYEEIVDRTTGGKDVDIQHVSSGAEIMRFRQVIRSVPVPDRAKKYAVRLVVGTQPKSEFASQMVNEAVALGSSPRGVQGLMLAGKVRALLAGRFAVSVDDVRDAAMDVLRHRVITTYEAEAEGLSSEDVIRKVFDTVPVP
jgi:MoxR-like ATPase